MNDYEILRCTESIFELIDSAFFYLYDYAKKTGHWDDIRSSALAIMCLAHREEAASYWLNSTRNWLLNQQILSSDNRGSWNCEIWDTALAICALKETGIPTNSEPIKNALAWISDLFSLSGNPNWHNEPWETSWALIAIFEAGLVSQHVDLSQAIQWLKSLQDVRGKLIATHYTAYGIFINHLSGRVEMPNKTRKLLKELASKGNSYLMEVLEKGDSEHLWAGEAWANGQILWILNISGNFPIKNKVLIEKTINWFKTNQSDNGNWSDIEDTASAILGLLALTTNLLDEYYHLLGTTRDVDVEICRRLRQLPLPHLSIKKRFIERDKESGYISVNIRESVLKIILATVAFLLITLLGIIANILQVLGSLFK